MKKNLSKYEAKLVKEREDLGKDAAEAVMKHYEGTKVYHAAKDFFGAISEIVQEKSPEHSNFKLNFSFPFEKKFWDRFPLKVNSNFEFWLNKFLERFTDLGDEVQEAYDHADLAHFAFVLGFPEYQYNSKFLVKALDIFQRGVKRSKEIMERLWGIYLNKEEMETFLKQVDSGEYEFKDYKIPPRSKPKPEKTYPYRIPAIGIGAAASKEEEQDADFEAIQSALDT